MPKQTLGTPPMRLQLVNPKRLGLSQPLADQVRPTERERQQRQQLRQPLRIRDVRLFEAEAATLQTAEQSFYSPAHTILVQSREIGRAHV